MGTLIQRELLTHLCRNEVATITQNLHVISYPVTSRRYGIQNLSSQFFDEPSDIAVAGVNVGAN